MKDLYSINHSMIKLVLLFALSGFCVSCSLVEQENTGTESEEEAKQQTKKDTQSHSNVEVTSSQAKQSKPLSDSAGNAEQKKNDETYIVPNKEFPAKDDKHHNKTKDKEPPKGTQ